MQLTFNISSLRRLYCSVILKREIFSEAREQVTCPINYLIRCNDDSSSFVPGIRIS